MSRHIPRSERWERVSPTELRSGKGLAARYYKRAWWAEVAYRLMPEEMPPGVVLAWEPHADTLGPFKRERNAMVEAERHATMLQNRHGERIEFGAV
jgi:hypothetical protein